MIVTPKVMFGPSALTDTAAAVLTTPTNARYVLTAVVFTNIDTDPHTVTVNIGRGGDAAATANIVVDAYAVSPGESWVSPALRGMVLGTGDIVYAFADVASVVNVTGSGYATQ